MMKKTNYDSIKDQLLCSENLQFSEWSSKKNGEKADDIFRNTNKYSDPEDILESERKMKPFVFKRIEINDDGIKDSFHTDCMNQCSYLFEDTILPNDITKDQSVCNLVRLADDLPIVLSKKVVESECFKENIETSASTNGSQKSKDSSNWSSEKITELLQIIKFQEKERKEVFCILLREMKKLEFLAVHLKSLLYNVNESHSLSSTKKKKRHTPLKKIYSENLQKLGSDILLEMEEAMKYLNVDIFLWKVQNHMLLDCTMNLAESVHDSVVKKNKKSQIKTLESDIISLTEEMRCFKENRIKKNKKLSNDTKENLELFYDFLHRFKSI
ncbi:hypothetical protein CEXT_511411 [Caerostris extrusa]|uniref:Uncharacterized protein n=1 Tax=Caerostris extrusa TaxID=172846 RepID=A0AAV4Y9Y6_CAEEX|nr:hypothetical protein CEXT_511411 [Caerostris extrusa]